MLKANGAHRHSYILSFHLRRLLAMLSCVFALFSVFGLARAAAAPPSDAFKALSATQLQSFKPYSLYAAAAYCPSSQTQSWSCGWDRFMPLGGPRRS